MKKPEKTSLISLGEYNWKRKKMTISVYETESKTMLFQKTIKGGYADIAQFLSAAEAFRILDASIETEKEYRLVYINDWDSLREVRAAECVSGLFIDDMLNFYEIDVMVDEAVDVLQDVGLKALKEKTKMWDKHLLGELNDYLI